MFLKKYGDLITGIVFLGLAIAFYAMSMVLPANLLGGVGSDFVPKIVAVITGIIAILQIITGIRAVQKVDTEALKAEMDAEEFKPEYKRVLITIIVFTVYVMALKTVGFIISSTVYLFIQMIILATKEKKNYILFAIISVAFSVVVYFLFKNGLNVMLPAGILG